VTAVLSVLSAFSFSHAVRGYSDVLLDKRHIRARTMPKKSIKGNPMTEK
jgi:hypothetical protein